MRLSLSHYYNLFVYHLRKYRNNQEMIAAHKENYADEHKTKYRQRSTKK